MRKLAPRAGTVAYLLKGYPRLSELFIASEIYRLERLGLPLRLFVVKPCDESLRHPIVSRIAAQPEYLQPADSISGVSAVRWALRHLRRFGPDLARVFARHPLRFLRAAGAAALQSFRARRGWRWKRLYLKEFVQAASLARRLDADDSVRHIHAHFCHGATTIAWLASLLTGIPFSFTAHAKDIYVESLNPCGLLRRKMDAARFTVTCTEFNREHLAALGSSTPVHCVYHGLNAEFAELARPVVERTERGPGLRVLGVGRLVRKKGFDVLVEACARLHGAGVPVELTLAGESGDDEDELRRRIAALGLGDCARIAGPLRQSDLLVEYHRADVFCLPCRVLDNGDRDGIPNVLVEAMEAGVPVVASGVSGIPELVEDGVNGLLTAPDDVDSVAVALARLESDGALRQRLAAQGRRTIRRRFDGEVLARRLHRLFLETA